MKNFEIKKLRLVKNEQKLRNGTSWDFTPFLINWHCVYYASLKFKGLQNCQRKKSEGQKKLESILFFLHIKNFEIQFVFFFAMQKNVVSWK